MEPDVYDALESHGHTIWGDEKDAGTVGKCAFIYGRPCAWESFHTSLMR